MKNLVCNYDFYSKKQIDIILEKLKHEDIDRELNERREAIERLSKIEDLLKSSERDFPDTVDIDSLVFSVEKMKEKAILLTAGGEGTRLKEAMIEAGYKESDLENFTKVTTDIPDLKESAGSLEFVLKTLKKIFKKHDLDIPVFISLGPKSSNSSKIIKRLLEKNNNFSIKKLFVFNQDERIHFSSDEKLVLDSELNIIKNPDETGGPIAKMKEYIEHLEDLSVKKLLVLQAIGVYTEEMLERLLSVGDDYDLYTVGIARTTFLKEDPYGTIISLNDGKSKKIRILERQSILEEDRKLKNEGKYLPYNTGLYVFNLELLKKSKFPLYASPKKPLKQGVDPSEKIGYAATDLCELTDDSAVLLVDENSFAVIKDLDSLKLVSKLARKIEKNF